MLCVFVQSSAYRPDTLYSPRHADLLDARSLLSTLLSTNSQIAALLSTASSTVYIFAPANNYSTAYTSYTAYTTVYYRLYCLLYCLQLLYCLHYLLLPTLHLRPYLLSTSTILFSFSPPFLLQLFSISTLSYSSPLHYNL